MYQYVDAALVRAAVWPPTQDIGPWPDLTGPMADAEAWRLWLRRTLQVPGFAAALEHASPGLAWRVREIRDGRNLSDPTVRRAVLAVMRYLLRARGRATPFGLFAGVAAARIADRFAARTGTAHRAVTAVDAGWLTAVIGRLESEAALRPRLTVLANNLVFERDGHFVLEHRPSGSSNGPPAHVLVRANRLIRAAMSAADDPIRVEDLAGKLAAGFPTAPAGVVDTLLANLVTQRLLVTSLRPAMARSDPLGHLLDELDAVDADEIAEIAATVGRLHEIADTLARHYALPADADVRAQVGAAARAACPTDGPLLHVDLRLDWDLVVPCVVAAEAAQAAGVLVRLARRPALSLGWIAWHERFLERYGPHALVPVLDVVDADIGLGYPAGYLGGPVQPARGALTDRDVKLLALAQNTALRQQRTIVLDDAMIADLTAVDPAVPAQPTTELTVRVHALSPQALELGEFTLAIVGVSRTAGTTTGRFLDLLDADDRDRMAAMYANLPTATEGALTAQISVAPAYANAEGVARTPMVLAHLLPLGEYHDGVVDGRIALEDVAVTADVHRLYLVSRARRRPLEVVALNAVELTRHTHPLARFLIEATSALRVPCTSFDWGPAAGTLPYLPEVQYGRTILSPARWLLPAADLPGTGAGWPEWDRAFAARQHDVGLPQAVYLGDGDQRIGIDLSEPAHRALLRAHLDRTSSALLRAAPDADGAGWIDGHVHEVVIPLATTRRPVPAPPWPTDRTAVGRDHGHPPGTGGRFLVKLYGPPDRQTAVLTRHLPGLLHELGAEVRWWFLRYHDPDHHLRLRLTTLADLFAPTATAIGVWSQHLRQAGLIARVQWDTDFPEAARFGGSTAMDAAEGYFAADSAAALAQLTAASTKGGPDLRALTAASMVDITSGWTGNADAAMTWLIAHARTETTAPDRALYDQALRLANPTGHRDLATQPGGEQILARWAARRAALGAYRDALDQTGQTAVLLPELLHLHHVRIAGTDMTAERACLHLARAAALSWTARTARAS